MAHARTAAELRQHMESGKRIVITTIQKFPFIVDEIADLSDKRFAVIIDEAHSSQGGTAADQMNVAMGMTAEEGEDTQDMIVRAMRERKMRNNASYYAFTATPKNSTLERFGEQREDGSFHPFHLYSMKQAIEEEFILDVLANYTTYRSYYEIEKSVQENPEFNTRRAQGKLRGFVEQHRETIATKAQIMMDHFLTKVVSTKKLKGKAKGMVVTQNIEAAIRYYFALKKVLEDNGSPFKILVAFSGEKEVDGNSYTEARLNGFSENDTRDKFDEDEYRLLVVANKYLTGFDQPKLSTMYVDKRLQGVLAVQALSRLNRSANSLGKRTEDLFVLDFFNSVDDIKNAFDPFYTATSLSEATDVNVLHELMDHMEDVGVYEWQEVVEFTEGYFRGVDAQVLSQMIDVAAERFNVELELEDEQKADFKIKAKQFVKIYGQVAAILDFEILKWEQLYWFLKFLIPKLIVKAPDEGLLDELLESVDLSTYGLERTRLSHTIGLDDAEAELKPQNPNPRGAHGGEEEKETLEDIIIAFNQRWFEGLGDVPEENIETILNVKKRLFNDPDFILKYADNPDEQNKDLALRKMLDDAMVKIRRNHMRLYRFYNQDDSNDEFFHMIKRLVDMEVEGLKR